MISNVQGNSIILYLLNIVLYLLNIDDTLLYLLYIDDTFTVFAIY